MCEFREKPEEANSNGSTSTVSTIENGVKPAPKSHKNAAASFELALAETKFGKFNYFLIIVAGLILTNVLLETLGISFVVPVSQCDLELTTQRKGILSAIGFAGIITSSHLWGFLADTTGRRRVILPTLLMAFLITVISSFVDNFWAFVVLRYLNGFFISGGSATIYAYLGEFHTTTTRSRAIMGASFIFGIGAMLLPAVAWFVINQEWILNIPIINVTYKPWRLFLVVCGIPGLICSICLLKIPESPKFVMSQNQENETIDILQKMFTINTGKDKNEYKIKEIIQDLDVNSRQVIMNKNKSFLQLLRSMWIQTAPLFMRSHLRDTILACVLQFGIFATSNGMYMWFPDILNRMVQFMNDNPDNRTTICEIVYAKQIGFDENIKLNNSMIECNEKLDTSTYQHSLVLEILYAVGFALIGFIINSVGKLRILFVILVGCGACGIAAVLVDIPMLAIYLYLILLLCGLGVTVVNAATVDLFPTHLRAMAVCISLMMGRLGSVVGANIVGILLDNNCELAFLASGMSLIICGFLGFLIPNPPKGPKISFSRRDSLISMTGN